MPSRVRLLVAALVALTPATAAAQAFMHWPTDKSVASSHPLTQGFYGDYLNYCGTSGGCGTHRGYDYSLPVGIPLHAVAPGVVDDTNLEDVKTSSYGNAGKWVRVRHDGSTVPGLGATYYVAYLHMSQIQVSPGQPVDTTTVLGLSGNTGNVGAHLHLHIAQAKDYCSAPVDPGCPTPDYVAGSVIPSAFFDAPGCQSVCQPVPSLWLQPAAYGGEPYTGAPLPDPCGDVTAKGQCDGETLRWCENGLKEASCPALNAVCTYQDDAIGYNCLRCDPASNKPLLPGPRCEGSRFLRCDGATAVSTDCAAQGATCTPEGCQSPLPGGAGGESGAAGSPAAGSGQGGQAASGGKVSGSSGQSGAGQAGAPSGGQAGQGGSRAGSAGQSGASSQGGQGDPGNVVIVPESTEEGGCAHSPVRAGSPVALGFVALALASLARHRRS